METESQIQVVDELNAVRGSGGGGSRGLARRNERRRRSSYRVLAEVLNHRSRIGGASKDPPPQFELWDYAHSDHR